MADVRTDQEIIDRIKKVRGEDMLGFETSDLAGYLTAEQVKELDFDVKDPEKWEVDPRDRASIIEVMRDYMKFALEKANNHRGISASRSISHYGAWIWMLGDEEYAGFDWANYPRYGVPILWAICDRYEFPFPTDDAALENMSKGEPCTPSCEEGCGS